MEVNRTGCFVLYERVNKTSQLVPMRGTVNLLTMMMIVLRRNKARAIAIS